MKKVWRLGFVYISESVSIIVRMYYVYVMVLRLGEPIHLL